ncbi:MAG TPA: zinc-dependent metalloprotease [Acidimicrobiales bacterium]|nr:zinc-dependent metalloprotease [Acidimicrobiales bacterium]
MAEAVAWGLAERVAVRVAGTEPLARSYHYASLAPDFAELTVEAEELVFQELGFRSLRGPARAEVVDRADWVRANLGSMRRLLRPLTERLGSSLRGPLALPAQALSGVEVGTMLGWMATRVLGQYDALLFDEEGAGDVVYYVGPNVLALEKRFGFPPREFRLWLALHEVTHRVQFTGVPWMYDYFRGLVDATVNVADIDPKRFLDALRRSVEAVRDGRNPLDEGGLVALLAGPEQYETLQKTQGLMSLLEGHGDTTMNRAGKDRIPSAARFAATLHARRSQRQPALAKFIQQLVGLEAKMKQYEAGERFIEAVEAAGGPTLMSRVWEGPEMLPNLGEIRDPEAWIRRITDIAPSLALAK